MTGWLAALADRHTRFDDGAGDTFAADRPVTGLDRPEFATPGIIAGDVLDTRGA